MTTYRKAPKYEGKNLTLMVGRGDVKVKDNVEYSDSRFAKFVKMGFMVEVEESPLAKEPEKKVESAPTVRKKRPPVAKRVQKSTPPSPVVDDNTEGEPTETEAKE